MRPDIQLLKVKNHIFILLQTMHNLRAVKPEPRIVLTEPNNQTDQALVVVFKGLGGGDFVVELLLVELQVCRAVQLRLVCQQDGREQGQSD